LEFSNRLYLIDLYRDQHPNIVFTKAAQMGLSERLLAEAIWIPDQLSKNVLYTFPTQSHLQDFVQARLDPVLNNSDYFVSRIEGANMNQKDISKIGLKRIGKGFLYLRGSQNEKQIITIDADAVILDERDRFIQQNVPFIDKRTLASTRA
jgi:phage terminase large subunit GpA-like protein